MSNLKAASIGGGQPEVQAEIPSQIQRLSYDLQELRGLLGDLHIKLGPIMPPACPEAECLSAIERAPDSEIGQQLADHSRNVRQSISSVRNMLDRIRL